MSIYVDAFVDLVRKHQKPAMSVADIGCFDWQTDTNPHVYKPNKNVRKDFERNLTGFDRATR